MKAYAWIALLPLSLGWMQDDADILRVSKLKAIGDWVGKWNAEMVLRGIPELNGLKMIGEIEVKWDLDKTALRFDGWTKPDPTMGVQTAKRITFTGLLTFNHEGERAYKAVFSWSEDGRMLLAKGDFKGKQLLLNVDIQPSRAYSSMGVRVEGMNPRRITVFDPSATTRKSTDWLEITLRRP